MTIDKKKRHCSLHPCLLWIYKKRTDPYLINGCFPGCILLGKLLWGYSWLLWFLACMSSCLHFCISCRIGWEEQRHLCPSCIQRLSGRRQVSIRRGGCVHIIFTYTHRKTHRSLDQDTHSSVSSLLDSLSHLLLKWLARSSKPNPRFHKAACMKWWVAAVRNMSLLYIEWMLFRYVKVGLLWVPQFVSGLLSVLTVKNQVQSD